MTICSIQLSEPVSVRYPLNVSLRPSSSPAYSMLLGVDRGPDCQSGSSISPQLHEIRATHIRTHDAGVLDWCFLFPNVNSDPEDYRNYNWGPGDSYFSEIMESGFIPYFRLGTSWSVPSPACLHPNVTLFSRVAVNTVKHYTEGWGQGFFFSQTIYWELWNEPDGPRFWNSSWNAFAELFDGAARALKAHNSSLQVGGPGVANALHSANYSFSLIDFIAEQGTPVDFFSFHGYGTDAKYPYEVYTPQAVALRARLDSVGLSRVRLHVTEWAPAILGNQSLLDSPAAAAYVATALSTHVALGVGVSIYYPACEGVGAGAWGLFEDGGLWRKAGRAYQAIGETLRDTPLPYGVSFTGGSGGGKGERRKAQGAGDGEVSVLAGRSGSGPSEKLLVNAVISAVSGDSSGALLRVEDLPSGTTLANVSAWCITESGAADPFTPCLSNSSIGVASDGVLTLPWMPLEVPGVLWVQIRLS